MLSKTITTVQGLRNLPAEVVFIDTNGYEWEIDVDDTVAYELNPHCVDCQMVIPLEGTTELWLFPVDLPFKIERLHKVKTLTTFDKYFEQFMPCTIKSVPYDLYAKENRDNPPEESSTQS